MVTPNQEDFYDPQVRSWHMLPAVRLGPRCTERADPVRFALAPLGYFRVVLETWLGDGINEHSSAFVEP